MTVVIQNFVLNMLESSTDITFSNVISSEQFKPDYTKLKLFNEYARKTIKQNKKLRLPSKKYIQETCFYIENTNFILFNGIFMFLPSCIIYSLLQKSTKYYNTSKIPLDINQIKYLRTYTDALLKSHTETKETFRMLSDQKTTLPQVLKKQISKKLPHKKIIKKF